MLRKGGNFRRIDLRPKGLPEHPETPSAVQKPDFHSNSFDFSFLAFWGFFSVSWDFWMRYGKIYYYDRMGNKRTDEEPVIKEEIRHFAANSPRVKVHANIPFDEHRIFPRAAETPEMNGRLTTQEMITFDGPSLPAELDDINFGPVDSPLAAERGYSIQGDTQIRQRAAYDQLYTPLNDLKDPDDPKQELARQMEQLDFSHSGISDELCDDCLADRSREQRIAPASVEVQDSHRLKYKLREHVDDINYELTQQSRRRELLPMNVLPPFANRPDEIEERRTKEKERHRLEIEDQKLREWQSERPRETDIREAVKLNELKDEEFNRIQAELRAKQRKEEEKERLEWWEAKEQPGEVHVERNRQHYADQLRRNENLKKNVQNLSEFEEKFRQKREADHLARFRHLDHPKEGIKEEDHELTRPEAARLQRERFESVWHSWVEAHRMNDKKYRVLQEFDPRRHRPVAVATRGGESSTTAAVECDIRRCRRCRRPLAKRVAFVAH